MVALRINSNLVGITFELQCAEMSFLKTRLTVLYRCFYVFFFISVHIKMNR